MSQEPASKRPRRRATSYDVARLAGVSQSAVSRVFKPGASASRAMRERVLKAAEEVGYRPNAIARGLITQRSNMVAVVISRMTNLNYPEVLVEMTQAFSERGVRVLLFTIERESEAESAIEQLLQYQVDGVVTAAILSDEQVEFIESTGVPVVFYNRAPSGGRRSAVRCDQEEGEHWLVGELVDAGHRRMAIVSGPADSAVSVERTQGALGRLHELGMSDVIMVEGDYSYASGREAFSAIMTKAGSAPDAVIAANDIMAIGCVDEAREAYGLTVPEDLSVVGFDGVGASQFAAYDLTTIRQPVERMARATVSMLLERVDDATLPAEERVFAGTRHRGSSARLIETNT